VSACVVEERGYEAEYVVAHDAQPTMDDLDEAVAIFLGERARLTRIAYRILHSVTEAEDVVQEVWLRWQKMDRTVVSNPPALLATMANRFAINVHQSARCQRETFGNYPAAEGADTNTNPVSTVERREALEEAVAIMLARLTAGERAAYVLREVFGYPYEEIAELLEVGASNTRQLVCRARRHLVGDRQATVSPIRHRRFVRSLLSATRSGDFAELEEFLIEDLAG